MRRWLVFKIGYVCQIPQEGGGRAYLANSLYPSLQYRVMKKGDNEKKNK